MLAYAGICNYLVASTYSRRASRAYKVRLESDAKFGVPKALISDQGSHFCNLSMATLLEKYGVVQ
ncbi:hypothetical protein CR513_28976, partial [Mucuna pruriens]